MRKRFEQQLSLGVVPIDKVEIEKKSRHQLPPVLTALQHMFTTPELNQSVFKLLERKILSGKKKTGRLGLSLWEILVLSSDIDYDFLLDLGNNHETLRRIMGVGKSDFTRGKTYELQTLKDNVGLLDEAIIREINSLVVQAGHELIKKKEGICLKNRKRLVVFQFCKIFPKTFSWTQRATGNHEKESTLLKKILSNWGVFV